MCEISMVILSRKSNLCFLGLEGLCVNNALMGHPYERDYICPISTLSKLIDVEATEPVACPHGVELGSLELSPSHGLPDFRNRASADLWIQCEVSSNLRITKIL
jgi:hypothetical protein